VNNGDGQEHGVAVAEIVKDMAPDAELWHRHRRPPPSDLRAAIDWFAANGVGIITRSLGAPTTGRATAPDPSAPSSTTRPTSGITWFNSAGNDADGGVRPVHRGRRRPTATSTSTTVRASTPTLTIIGVPCVGFDGIRWANDWGKPSDQVSDYQSSSTR
jgi:hypothetical protein